MKRRSSKCEECPYQAAKPSQRSHDELAYARCIKPKDFPCHLDEFIGDGETMCRGHWEVFTSAVKKGIQADESAGDRVFGFQETTTEKEAHE